MILSFSSWTVEFYTDSRGRSPAVEFLRQLTETEKAKIDHHIAMLSIKGVDERVPGAKKIAGHSPLWELRPDKYRIIYVAHAGRRFIILHAFQKKTPKTPLGEISTAERRYNEFLKRERE